jgi:hypothetical protein
MVSRNENAVLFRCLILPHYTMKERGWQAPADGQNGGNLAKVLKVVKSMQDVLAYS